MRPTRWLAIVKRQTGGKCIVFATRSTSNMLAHRSEVRKSKANLLGSLIQCPALVFILLLLLISLPVNSKEELAIGKIDASFWLRSLVSVYQDDKQVASTLSHEFYDTSNRRAQLEIKRIHSAVSSFKSQKRTSYHHEPAHGIWLRHSQGSRCEPTDHSQLEDDLYGMRLPVKRQLEVPDYIVGSASLWASKLRASHNDSSKTSQLIRGRQVLVSEIQVADFWTTEAQEASVVIYGVAETDAAPMRVELCFRASKSSPRTRIIVDFLQWAPLTSSERPSDDLVAELAEGQSSSSLFLFPLAKGCGSLILSKIHSQPAELISLLMALEASNSRVQFKSRELVLELGSLRDSFEASELEVSHDIDQRAKLMRRDTLVQFRNAARERQLVKRSIYDFGNNLEHSKIEDIRRHEIRPNEACYSQQISLNELANEHLSKFIETQRLVFMGRVKVDGLEAFAYEADGVSRLPFWLWPATGSPKDQPTSYEPLPSGTKTIVYYFAASRLASFGSEPFGPLLRVELSIWDPERNMKLLRRRFNIMDFRWNMNSQDAFALAQLCPANSQLRVSMLLTIAANIRLHPTESDTLKPLNERHSRDEALVYALANDLRIPRTQISGLQSQLTSKQTGASISLDLVLSSFAASRHINWSAQVATSGFIHGSRLVQLSCFADCLWLANHQAQQAGHEQLFAFNLQTGTCLITDEKPQTQIGSSNQEIHPAHGYAKFVLHLVKPSTQESAQALDLPRDFRGHQSVSLVGRDLELDLMDDSDLRLRYKVGQVRALNGDIQAPGEGNSIKGLAWSSSGQLDELTREAFRMDGGRMQLAWCREQCQLDQGCMSFSYCSSLARQHHHDECLLSKTSIRPQDLRSKLLSIVESKSEILAQGERVKLDRRCGIHEKRFALMFQRAHQSRVDLNSRQQVLMRNLTLEQCAEFCFKRNLVQWQEEEDLRVKRLHQACGQFHYSSVAAKESICSIPEADAIENPLASNSSSMVTLEAHKLLFNQLYDKMPGFRLRESPIVNHVDDRQQDSEADQSEGLMARHLAGHNNLVIVPMMDSVEFCARACSLQNHGPRPACESFDFVRESITINNRTSTRTLCQLNSQSLKDLKGRESKLPISYNISSIMEYTNSRVSSWHFEPRESIFKSSNTNHISNLFLWLNSHHQTTSEQPESSGQSGPANTGLWLMVFMVAVASGIIIGAELGKMRMSKEEPEVLAVGELRDSGQNFNRLIYQVNGVQLRRVGDESEVRM